VSALEKTSAGGQSDGLAAGANVLTINFTGAKDIDRYLIYGKNRFVVGMNHVRSLLVGAGYSTRGSIFLPGVV
jgi:biotin synthase